MVMPPFSRATLIPLVICFRFAVLAGVCIRLLGGAHVGETIDCVLAGLSLAVVVFARSVGGQSSRQRGGDVDCGHVCFRVGTAIFAFELAAQLSITLHTGSLARLGR